MATPSARESANSFKRAHCPHAPNGPAGTLGRLAPSHVAPGHIAERERANATATTSALAAGARLSSAIRACAAASGTSGPIGMDAVSRAAVASRHAIALVTGSLSALAIALAQPRSDGKTTSTPNKL